jgi:hypothetical protein
MDLRSLWTAGGHEEKPFNFQDLLAESIKVMKLNGNRRGLDELAKAVAAVKALTEAP